MGIDVLLVDEDVDVIDVVATFLDQEDDLTVHTETDPEAALETSLAGDHDAVISDYQMPRLTGVDLCRELREAGSSLPFILFSAREPADIQAEADEAGVSAVVQKGTGTEQYSTLADEVRAAV